MQVYMLPVGGLDASSAPVEVELPHGAASTKTAQIGDLVLGLISIAGGPGGIGANVTDETAKFASIVTESSTQPGVPVLVQSSQNLNGVLMIALMQRGNLQT